MSDAGQDDLRVGTREREEAVKFLGDHFAAGRIPVGEYEERVTAALDARTRGDLRTLFGDLPEPLPTFMTRPKPAAAPPAVVAAGSAVETVTEAGKPAELSDKSRIAAGLLQIIFPFGTGRFYTGHTRMAVTQLCLVFVGVGVIWSLIDGVLLLLLGGEDPDGRKLRVV